MPAPGFEYFHSGMSGAPALTGQVGRLIQVLDWALVGKGGWTKPFTGTNLAVYRSDSGNRMFLRVEDTVATYTRLRAYRNMTTVSAGTNQFPTSTQAGSVNTWGIRKAFTAGSNPQRYWGVRTNRMIILVVEHTSMTDVGTLMRNWMVWGDVPSLCEADSHNTILCAQPGVDASYTDFMNNSMALQPPTPTYVPPATGVGTAISGTPNGAVASPLCATHFPYPGGADTHKAALSLSDRMFFGAILLTCSNSVSTPNGVFPRAVVPNVHGLYGACASGAPDPQLSAEDLVPVTIGARQFLPLCRQAVEGYASSTEALLLEITDTNGAL